MCSALCCSSAQRESERDKEEEDSALCFVELPDGICAVCRNGVILLH